MRVGIAVVAAAAAALVGAHGAWAATYVVDKTSDLGGEACTAAPSDCSLRSAIQLSNASAGTTDTISFNVAPAGAVVLAPALPLPQITDPAVIDATTEPGYIGKPLVQLDGSSAGPGANGLWITGGSTTVTGLSIVNFSFDGIRLETGGGNIVSGNWLGVDASGLPAGNIAYGVDIRSGSASNVVGGASGNVISANGLGTTPFSGVGVFGAGTGGTVVSANYIGTDTTGSADAGYGNGYAGVLMRLSGGNFVGGLGNGNVISRNGVVGVFLDRETGDQVLNNRIGTDATGSLGAPNQGDGILVFGSGGVGSGNTIGSSTGSSNARNVISGNAGSGIRVFNLDSTTIVGNYIGTDALGLTDLGNAAGITVDTGSTNTTVGTGPSGGNLISGNDVGVVFQNGASGNNLVNNNTIGPTSFGLSGIGNGTGIRVADTSSAKIGENYTNTIAYNHGVGVKVETVGVAKISSNNIYANGRLGIDLVGGVGELANGVTPNDSQDVDSGANTLQNSPVITNVVSGGNVDFTLDEGTFGDYAIDLFRSSSCDPSGYGEGENFFASFTVTHGGGGVQAFSHPVGPLTAGQFITATARIAIAGPTAGSTSEFSKCFEVSGQTFTVNSTADPGDGTCDASCTLRDAILNANATPAADTIAFNIGGGGAQTITLGSALPATTAPLTIDGSTQPGYAGAPLIVISRGAALPGDTGLTIQGGGSIVRGLVINGFSNGVGIALQSAGSNIIAGNYIGTDQTGTTAVTNQTGISIAPGSNANVIGGTTAADRNVISGQGLSAPGNGIDIGSRGNLVQGNYIGVDATAVAPLANVGVGVNVGGNSNTIGGTLPGARNVISANTTGIAVSGTANRVRGNYIGTDAAGGSALPNTSRGVYVNGSNTLVGGSVAGAGNVISGNAGTGLFVDFAVNTVIRGNRIGTDPTGASVLANDSGGATPTYGVRVHFSDSTSIGGLAGTTTTGCTGSCNVISGNETGGILLDNASGGPQTRIEGNYVGTTADGLGALGNGAPFGDGIELVNGATAVIGGTAAAAGNLIAGNSGFGIRADGGTGLKIQGNKIGVDRTGNATFGPNSGDAINVRNTTNALVGGTVRGSRNVIGGYDWGVYLESNDGAKVQGNYVGLGADGVSDVGTSAANGAGVTVDQGSSATPTLIGGTGAGAGNYIAYNTEGILLFQAETGIQIQGNTIGLDTSYAGSGNDQHGVEIVETPGAFVGGASVAARNVISDNGGAGVRVRDSADATIQGNYIGTDPTGLASHGNGRGIYVTGDSPGAVIGGAATSSGDPPGNLIMDSDNEGILLEGSGGPDPDGPGPLPDPNPRGAHIRGNMIGLDSTGGYTVPNYGPGIAITNYAHDNVVGNDTGSGTDFNVINGSGDSTEPGVLIDGAGSDNNTVVGNRLGTIRDGTGNDSYGNDTGVTISGSAQHNTVGGATTDLRNLIAGNNDAGVYITGPATAHNTVQGNWIGVAIDGATELQNRYGARIEQGAHDNLVGGAAAGEGNLIASAQYDGVLINGNGVGTSANRVKGNSIGVAADLTTPLQTDIGVELTSQANNNVIGPEVGDPASAGNLIANSADTTMLLSASSGNAIAGNTIRDSAGDGIRLLTGSGSNTMFKNTITGSGDNGVRIAGDLGNKLDQNSIDGSAHLGIDLGPLGVTLNDVGDVDTGSNDGQNFPVVTAANIAGGDLTIQGDLDSNALNAGSTAASYRIEAFASPTCNPSGYGEGATPLGSAVVVVDGAGHFSNWSVTDLGTSVSPGEVVTTTATDEENNTSEFSQCFTVTSAGGPLAASINLTQDSQNVRAGAQSVPIAGIDLGALTRGAGPSTAPAPLDGIPLEGIKIAGSPLEGIPLSGIGLTPQILNQALGGVHLSDIPLTPPANWPALLAGTRLANVPLATLTLADVLTLPTLPAGFNNITLGSIDLSSSPLSGIPLAGIAVGPMLLKNVPLSGIGTSQSQNLQDWCNAINAAPGYSCASPSTLDGETVIGQVVKGVPLSGIPLDGIPLEGINLAGTPLSGIPLEGIDLSGTPLEGIPLEGINMTASPLSGIPLSGINIIGSPLSGIPLSGIPLSGINLAIDCSGGFCTTAAGNTLGDAVTANRIKPGATLGMLDGGYGTVTLDNLVDALKNGSGLSLADLVPGLPPGHTLHDLLAAVLGTSAYDWSQLNLNTFPIADFSSDGGIAHYHVDFQVTGGPLLIQPVTIHATLPAGGRYVPHTTTLALSGPSSPFSDPVEGGGGQLTWSLNALRGQQYTLSWNAKAGLDLGSSAVGANIQLSNGTSVATPVSTTVIQTFNDTNLPNGDTNNDPDTAPQLAGNSLYLSHLTKGDVDYYKIPIGPYGSRVEVTLSHIPAGSDYDLALAGPTAPRLRAAPANAIPLGNQELPDIPVELNHRQQALPPEALQDVPTAELTTSGRTLRAVADNRGSSPEHLSLLSQGESGYWTIQVSDYEGDSPDPYVLEVKSIPPPNFGPCTPRSISNSPSGAAPTVNAGTQTLFLVDEKRLTATFGGSATSTLMSKLATFATRSDVLGSVVRVETGPGVPAAYDAWDASPCSPELANNVVRSIGSYIDTLSASAPNLKYIVVVGGDDIVPFARVPDNTEIANERTYRESLGSADNQYLASIGAGFLLTDDVWGEKAAQEFLGSELFVPELGVGRLVESPTDIGTTLDGFTAANGLLTPTSSLVTGYDFLTDGAQQINAPFAAGLGTNAKTLINETWDRTQLLAQLFPAGGGGPKLNSLNAHFDHQRLLPAAENAANRQTNLVTTSDITTAMSGRLGFSLGCHSGLVVSDAVFGAGNLLGTDWAQAMLGNGAFGWIGNTGYGLGDTTDVAYSERLHALFARKLDGTLTVGQALEQAKQDYLGTSAVLTGYDAKVMMEATLYGLPMLKLGPGIPPSPPPALPLHTDPATGLQAAGFDVTPAFTRVTTANGNYDRADNGIQSTPRRPLEPLVSLDVTQPGTLVAHGALITLLNSPAADETGFDAVFSQVTTDQAADDPALAGVNAFPSKIQSVASFTNLGARAQRLNLIVGLFRSDGPTLAGIGTHRRYTRVAGDVLYSTSNDWLEPQLGELQALRVLAGSNTVGFSAVVTDPTTSGAGSLVKSVKVVYRDCNGAWRTITLSPASGNRWSGGGTVLPTNCLNIDYYLEAADGAGNVAVSSKKVQLEPLTVPVPQTPAGSSPITHLLSPAAPTASGWYGGPVQVTLNSAESIRYSIDGAPDEDYTAPFNVTGDGVHFIHAHTPLGATDDIGLGIDGAGPVTTITRTPGTPDVNGWYVFNVNEQVSAVDPGGSDVAQIRCVLDPASVPTLFSQLPASCPYTAGGSITADGVHKLYAAAVDGAGNAGAVVLDTFGIDRTPPTTTMGALAPFQTATSFSPTWSGTDTGSGIKNYDIRYRQAASNASTFGGYTAWQNATVALSAVFSGTAGTTTCFSGRARDNAGWVGGYSAESCTAVPLDDTTLTRSGSWSTVSAADLFGGTASRTTTYGGTLTSPTMVGKTIGVLVTKQPGGGTIQLRWNGSTMVSQSLSATTRQPKQLVSFTLGSVQTGTLQVYVPNYGTVEIDGAGAFKTP